MTSSRSRFYPCQVPRKDLERALMFNTGFQSSVAIAKCMENAIGALSADRELLRELQKEVDGKVRVMMSKAVCSKSRSLRHYPEVPLHNI